VAPLIGTFMLIQTLDDMGIQPAFSVEFGCRTA